MNLKQLFAGLDPLADAMNLGPIEQGHYIQIGLGTGFYIPESDYEAAQSRANEMRQVQFVGVTRAGIPIHGTRDEIHANPESAGLVAWIFPKHDEGRAGGVALALL